MEYKIENSEQLSVLLHDVLAIGPLYRPIVYGGNAHETLPGGRRYASLPKRLRLFCEDEHCKQETWWQTEHEVVFFDTDFIHGCSYLCRNCGRSRVHYYFIWQERKSQNIFIKIGQYPELEERVSESLSKALDSENLKTYKKALRMRNFGLGLAAVAYMRRVVENKMNDMLVVLHEAAVAHNVSSHLLARHEEIKKEKRFSVKVEYAGDLLPQYLRPTGKPNPMAILHELASDGIHAKSDEECVEIFDKCRATFEYVFGKMRIEAEEAKNFIKAMADLTQERTKVLEAKPAAKQA